MTGYVAKGAGHMTYHLHIDGCEKPCRIYWRNHGQSYIKQNGAWIRVYFNHYILATGSYDQIPMQLSPDGEWEMVHTYTELPDRSYVLQSAD